MANEIALRVDGLRRCFGKLVAVDGLSFEIRAGEVVGFVGANGAGKTTTMRVLATLDLPDAGNCEVLGKNVVLAPELVRPKLGWMPDELGNFDGVTVVEYLDFFARAMGFKGSERRQRIDEVMEFTELFDLADRFSNKMSKGQTQRLGLARALIHDPQVLIMDEPAAGLDPKARVELKNLIRVLADDGKTILISSHILSELGEMCDQLLFIDAGKLVYKGSADTLRHAAHQGGRAIYRLQVMEDTAKLEDWVLMSPYVEWVDELRGGGRVRIDSADPERAAEVLARLVGAGFRVTEFHREQRNLEDAFIEMLGGSESSGLREVLAGRSSPLPVTSGVVPPPIPKIDNVEN